MAVAVVRDVGLIVSNVVAEFANRAQHLLTLSAKLFAIEHRLQLINQPQRLIDVAVPQVPLHAFQVLLDSPSHAAGSAPTRLLRSWLITVSFIVMWNQSRMCSDCGLMYICSCQVVHAALIWNDV